MQCDLPFPLCFFCYPYINIYLFLNYNAQFTFSVDAINIYLLCEDSFLCFICCRFLSFFSDDFKTEEADDIHAALALMYGYAAKYAPSTVIEARIDALVVWDLVLFLMPPTTKKEIDSVFLPSSYSLTYSAITNLQKV